MFGYSLTILNLDDICLNQVITMNYQFLILFKSVEYNEYTIVHIQLFIAFL